MTPSATLTFHGTRLTLLRTLYAAGAVALSLTLAASQPRPAAADPKDDIVVPAVPANLQVPAGNKVYLEGHAAGTQNYICLPCPNPINTAACPASGFIWTLFGPQATLFDVDEGDDDQIITHFLSTNPADGKARPTWQHSRDTSAVWGNAIASATSTTDPDFVAAGAIPDAGELLLLVNQSADRGPYEAAKQLAGARAEVTGRAVRKGGVSSLIVESAAEQ